MLVEVPVAVSRRFGGGGECRVICRLLRSAFLRFQYETTIMKELPS